MNRTFGSFAMAVGFILMIATTVVTISLPLVGSKQAKQVGAVPVAATVKPSVCPCGCGLVECGCEQCLVESAPRMPYADEVNIVQARELLKRDAVEPKSKVLNFDLSGIWDVSLINGVGGEKWKATWNLKARSRDMALDENGRIKAILGGTWDEELSKGKVYFKVLNGGDTSLLRWCRGHDTMYFDIEEVPGFGGLILNGTDGKQYLAVRIEGGEGENKP